MSRIFIEINPDVMEWLFSSSGWSYKELAKKLQTSEQSLKKIIMCEKKITYRQLEILSNAFKRPIATFLLPKPKAEKPKPKDYRMVPNRTDIFDKKTILAMRKARYLQGSIRELKTGEQSLPSDKIRKLNISENPSEVAIFYRKEFGLTKEKQEKFSNTYNFLYFLRNFFEEMNLYVFQFPMPVKDARGFNYADEFPYIIVINSSDDINARVFTLLHEFGHILLGESVIDIPSEMSVPEGKFSKIEKWCNEFASNFLLPENISKSVFTRYHQNLTTTESLSKLSRKYKLSKYTLLLKMLKLGYIDKNELKNVLNRYDPDVINENVKSEDESQGGPSMDVKCVSQLGSKFINIVADNVENKKITFSDALGYLSIKSKHYDKVLARTTK